MNDAEEEGTFKRMWEDTLLAFEEIGRKDHDE